MPVPPEAPIRSAFKNRYYDAPYNGEPSMRSQYPIDNTPWLAAERRSRRDSTNYDLQSPGLLGTLGFNGDVEDGSGSISRRSATRHHCDSRVDFSPRRLSLAVTRQRDECQTFYQRRRNYTNTRPTGSPRCHLQEVLRPPPTDDVVRIEDENVIHDHTRLPLLHGESPRMPDQCLDSLNNSGSIADAGRPRSTIEDTVGKLYDRHQRRRRTLTTEATIKGRKMAPEIVKRSDSQSLNDTTLGAERRLNRFLAISAESLSGHRSGFIGLESSSNGSMSRDSHISSSPEVSNQFRPRSVPGNSTTSKLTRPCAAQRSFGPDPSTRASLPRTLLNSRDLIGSQKRGEGPIFADLRAPSATKTGARLLRPDTKGGGPLLLPSTSTGKPSRPGGSQSNAGNSTLAARHGVAQIPADDSVTRRREKDHRGTSTAVTDISLATISGEEALSPWSQASTTADSPETSRQALSDQQSVPACPPPTRRTVPLVELYQKAMDTARRCRLHEVISLVQARVYRRTDLKTSAWAIGVLHLLFGLYSITDHYEALETLKGELKSLFYQPIWHARDALAKSSSKSTKRRLACLEIMSGNMISARRHVDAVTTNGPRTQIAASSTRELPEAALAYHIIIMFQFFCCCRDGKLDEGLNLLLQDESSLFLADDLVAAKLQADCAFVHEFHRHKASNIYRRLLKLDDPARSGPMLQSLGSRAFGSPSHRPPEREVGDRFTNPASQAPRVDRKGYKQDSSFDKITRMIAMDDQSRPRDGWNASSCFSLDELRACLLRYVQCAAASPQAQLQILEESQKERSDRELWKCWQALESNSPMILGTAGLKAAIQSGSFSQASVYSETLRTLVPGEVSPEDRNRLAGLYNLRQLARRDFLLNSQVLRHLDKPRQKLFGRTSANKEGGRSTTDLRELDSCLELADVLFEEWIVLWPSSLIREAGLAASAGEVSSDGCPVDSGTLTAYRSDADLDTTAETLELLAMDALRRSMYSLALQYATQALRILRLTWQLTEDNFVPSTLTEIAGVALCRLLSWEAIDAELQECLDTWRLELDALPSNYCSSLLKGIIALYSHPGDLEIVRSNLRKALEWERGRDTTSNGTSLVHRIGVALQITYQKKDYTLPLVPNNAGNTTAGLPSSPLGELYNLILENSFRALIDSFCQPGKGFGMSRTDERGSGCQPPSTKTAGGPPPAQLSITISRLASELLEVEYPAEDLERALLEVALLVYSRRHTEAESALKRISQRTASLHPLLSYWQCYFALRKRRWAEAMEAAAKAWPQVRMNSLKYGRYFELYATSCLMAKEYPTALEIYTQMLAGDPGNIAAAYQAGKISWEQQCALRSAEELLLGVNAAVDVLKRDQRIINTKSVKLRFKLHRCCAPLSYCPFAVTTKEAENYRLWSRLALLTIKLQWPGHGAVPDLTSSPSAPGSDVARLLECQDIADTILVSAPNNLAGVFLEGCVKFRQRKFSEVKMALSAALDGLSEASQLKNPEETARLETLQGLASERLNLIDIAAIHADRARERDSLSVEANVLKAILVARADRHSTFAESIAAAVALLPRGSPLREVGGDELPSCELAPDEAALVDGLRCYLRRHLATSDNDLQHSIDDLELLVGNLKCQVATQPFAANSRLWWISGATLVKWLQMWTVTMRVALPAGNSSSATRADDVQFDDILRAYLRSASSPIEKEYLAKLDLRPDLILDSADCPAAVGNKLSTDFASLVAGDEELSGMLVDVKTALASSSLHTLCITTRLRTSALSGFLLLEHDISVLEGLLVSVALAQWQPPVEPALPLTSVPENPKSPFAKFPDGGSHLVRKKPVAGYHLHHPRAFQPSPGGDLQPWDMQTPLNKLFKVPIKIPASKLLMPQEFEIGRQLGSGGFATVYSGRLIRTDRPVAIKLMRLAFSEALLRDIISEINAMASLSHPSLVEFVGTCLNPRRFCVVTELCSGGSLYQRLHHSTTGPWDFHKRCQIARQIIEGVEYLHTRQPVMIHRDLKSLNVVLDSNDNAKICDFGLANSLELGMTHLSLRKDRQGGSPRYMAPECFDCKGRVSEKSDIWALSCVLIEVFGGPVPFPECKEVAQIVRKVAVDHEAPRIPSSFAASLKLILQQCFALIPKSRPSATEILSVINGMIPP